MKGFISLFCILSLVGIFFSCTLLEETNTLTINIPGAETSANTKTADSPEVAAQNGVVRYEISIINSQNQIQTQTAYPGGTVIFMDIPLGPLSAYIAAFDRNSRKILEGRGSTVIVSGDNRVKVTLTRIDNPDPDPDPQQDPDPGPQQDPDPGPQQDPDPDPQQDPDPDPQQNPDPEPIEIEIKLIYNASGDYKTLKKSDSLTTEDFAVSNSYVPAGKAFAYWKDGNNNKIKINTNDDVSKYVGDVKQSVVLTANYGIPISKIVDYVTGKNDYQENHVQAGETIIAIDDSTVTKLPSFSSSYASINNNEYIRNLTFDYSECTSCTSIDSSSYTNQTSGWCKSIILPDSLTTIAGVSRVSESIYIPLMKNQFTFGDRAAEGASNYSVHFAGTLSDWCYLLKQNVSYYTSMPVCYSRPLYVRDASGQEILVAGDLSFGGTIPCTGTDLTEINPYEFRKLQCDSLTFGDTVTKIDAAAFAFCSATKVYLSSNIERLGSGAFYYSENSEREFYYDGTLDDWMKVGCACSLISSGEGGPFNGGKTRFYVKNSSGSYGELPQSIEFNLGKSDKIKEGNGNNSFEDINGQLQGLRSIGFVTVNCTDEQNSYTVSSYAFYGCSELSKLEIKNCKTIDFGENVFGNTKLTELVLNTSEMCTCETTTFNSVNLPQDEKIIVKVPPSLLDEYKFDSKWSSLENIDIALIE